ncbi:MAG: hypothetical protein ACJAQT_001011 [Akkermansiaceae bacterium]|jgi:hypothetical protein
MSEGVPPQLALATKIAVRMRRVKVMEFGRFTRRDKCEPDGKEKQPFAASGPLI